jgi:hypothetical protein
MAEAALAQDRIPASADRDENEVISSRSAMHYPTVPSAEEEQTRFCAVRGFEIPSFPGLDDKRRDEDLQKNVLYRFQRFITQLHREAPFRVFALQFMSHPGQAERGSRVRAYLLCGAADEAPQKAAREAYALAGDVLESFPQDGFFAYGTPKPLNREALARVLFLSPGNTLPAINIVELRKFEDAESWPDSKLNYVPHRLWPDTQSDPWLPLIETLGQTKTETAIRVELTPAVFDTEAKFYVAAADRAFRDIEADLERLSSQGDRFNPDQLSSDDFRRPSVDKAREDALLRNYITRGAHVYEELSSYPETSFRMRLLIASRGTVPPSVIGGVRNALLSPPADSPLRSAGWKRLELISPTASGDPDQALDNLNFLAQTRWGPASQCVLPKLSQTPSTDSFGLRVRSRGESCIDLRSIVTPEEAVALFHLPIYERAGETSAVSTVDTPFVIPPETLSDDRDNELPGQNDQKKKRIVLGYMYQRDRLLKPVVAEADKSQRQPDAKAIGEAKTLDPGQPFHVTVDDLMKPSLLVGGPGSGKTNLAFSMLIELAGEGVPFLVLDPSTAQEFRMLVARPEPQLRELLVYTVGDSEGNPFAFNPFSVPPDVTIRAHITGLLAAFGAAIEMQVQPRRFSRARSNGCMRMSTWVRQARAISTVRRRLSHSLTKPCASTSMRRCCRSTPGRAR